MNLGIRDFEGLKFIHVIIDGYSYKVKIVEVLVNTVIVELSDGSNTEVKKVNTFR